MTKIVTAFTMDGEKLTPVWTPVFSFKEVMSTQKNAQKGETTMSQKSYEAENTRTDLIDGITDAQKKLSGVMGEVQAACIKCQNIHELKLAVREQQIEKLNGDYMALLDQADGLREENEKLTKELSLRKEYK